MQRENKPGEKLSTRLKAETGLNVRACYQCGKCSAGCPMAEEMRYRTHDILRMVAENRIDELFEDESMWICLSCETCSARCPNSCEPARVVDYLREEAHRQPDKLGPRKVRAFHKSFLKQIYSHGRIFELGLVMGYKLRSGSLFADVLVAPGIFLRGKLALRPHRVEGLDEVRRIFDACGVWDEAQEDKSGDE